MSEIKKISVDGVVYDIAATSSENPGGNVQDQLDSLNEKVTSLDEKITSEASRVDGMINQVNENTAASIQTLNDNLVQAINTINGGIAAEVSSREEGDKVLQENLDAEVKTREEEDNALNESLKALEEKVNAIEDPSELVEQEKSERETADQELSEKIDSSVKTLNETISTVNNNTASSIQTLNDNLVQAINTINGGIDNEIRPELEKAVKYKDFEYNGETRKTIELENYDSLSGLDTEGNGFNLAMVSKWNKADFGSAGIQMNLNSSGRVTVNDTEELAYLSDVATDQDFEALKTQVEENTTKIEEVNSTLVEAVGSLNESINTKTEEINNRIDTEVLQKIDEIDRDKVGLVETDKNGISTLNIVLENYASLFGKDTLGSMYNLAMVSKWNKADFGSASIELNLNGSKTRPTYNDTEELALVSDITGNIDEINLVKKGDLEYELQVGDRIAGTINIPKDQFFEGSDYNSETHILTLYFQADGESKSQDIDLSDLVDIYTAGNGLLLEGGKFSIKLDPSTDAYLEVTENGLRLVGLKEELNSKATKEELSAETEARTSADTQLQEDLQAEGEARIAADEEINTGLQKKVDYTDISDSENPERKTIQLKNHDSISGLNTDGTGFNIAMVSKWNKVDLGAGGIELNLNGSAERPTYNDDEELALLKDVEDIKVPVEFAFPIRTLQDKVYTQEEIFGWFGVSDAAELKELINREGQFYLRFGIILTGNPYNYKMPIQYIAFETSNQIKMVVLGLDTSNDNPVKYEIIINLDGTIAYGNSNIKVTMINLATEDEVNLKANQSDVDFQVNALNEKIDSINVPTKVSELENDSKYQTESEVDSRIQAIVGAAPEALDTLEEIASKLSDNDDAVAALTNQISTKANSVDLTAEIKARSAKDTELQGNIEAEAQTRQEKDQELETELSNKVSYTNVETEDNPGRKAIVLENHDTILGYTTENSAVNIAMVSKWNKVDLGSTQVEINLNGSAQRPTYNDDSEIALVEDLSTFATKEEVSLKADQSSVDTLEAKVDEIVVPTKVSELENDSNYQTAQDVDNRIQDLINAAPAELDTLGEIATALKDNESAVGAITSELANKANKSEIPTELPNPEALTIKYNGVTAFSYDGSKSETGNFIVNSETIPMSEEDATTLSAKIETLATKDSLESEASSRSNKDAELESKINKVANSKLYYPGVKVDTQKLYALTKESSEDDIKAALQIEVASGGYTLPTPEILDECLGKGYQLLSNWMPVSVAWNGAAYVFYTIGQTYMNQPNSIAQVAIKITDGVYSVFQAASIYQLASKTDLEDLQKVDEITWEDDYNSAKNKLANGVKTFVDEDGLIWSITEAVEKEIASEDGIKIAASRMMSNKVDSDGISSATGFIYASFQRTSNGNSWSKVISNYTITSKVDDPLNGNYIASTSFVDKYLMNTVFGDLDLSKYINDTSYSVQILNKLEQSYISDLGNPENINGQPYDAETNNYLVGQPYLSFAKFDESLTFHYDLYLLNGQFNMGYIGFILRAIKMNMDTYDSKITKIEERLTALESPTE